MPSKTNWKPGKINGHRIPFWIQPTFPQYRKIVNGEERLLDGTETAKTKIVKYDYSTNYKAWVDLILSTNAPKFTSKMPLLSFTGIKSECLSVHAYITSVIYVKNKSIA